MRRFYAGFLRFAPAGAVALFVSGAMALTLFSAAAPASAAQKLDVEAHFTEPRGESSDYRCDVVAGRCDFRYTGTTDWTGTLLGRGDYDFRAYYDPADGKLHYSGLETFTGTVRGCGTGTMVFAVDDGEIDLMAPGPGGFPGRNYWAIVRGSGTAGLQGLVSGEGEHVWVNKYDGSGEGDMTGTLRCKAR